MSRLLVPPLPPTPPQEETPFYGWRYLRRRDADGREYLEEIPLTLEDVLYPQENDEKPMRPQHRVECAYLAHVLTARFAADTSIAVLSKCLIDWGVAGQRNHEHDIAVFHDVRIPPNPRQGTFRLRASGGRVVLAIEVVSPDTRENDVVRKPVDYHRLGIPIYAMIDQQREEGPRFLHGYRWTPSGYEEMPLNAAGQLPLEPVGIALALEDGWLACYDTITGERLGDFQEISASLQEERKTRQKAEKRQRRAEKRQQQAEERQQQAEERQQQEAAARNEAEKRQQQAEERQRQAEERQQQEAAARQTAEERLRELEAELRRLRGQS